ncbi:hypothetical protein [Cohnella abietis]|uniref:Uncharacterized protein n=1 Tax=Cohnella abietis TaxID=2507935 RepID=A0A3T1DDV4_9BACL|nr:hypothetical protein [Cohnella abietis]BBI36341.1 hypothetical protein KCTCHS21_57400 [Cohnella abietis]
MGTRLLSEYLIKKYNPQLRYVRAHTNGKNKATLYVWNNDLQLPEQDVAALKQFVSGYLPSYVCFQIKAYSMIQADSVPQVYELPEKIVQTAMQRDLDQYGIVAVINTMLASGGMTFSRLDMNTGTLHFNVYTTTILTEIEKELINRYLSEIIPLGFSCKVSY